MIERNLILLNEKIKQACKTYSRKASQLNLIAVSKTFGSAEIICAIQSGCKIFGENYLKEAQEKWPEIKEKFPEIELHFIGHLQSNKAAEAVALFDCIQTLDSEKLARLIKKEADQQQKNPRIFIQVNIGEEPQKHGIHPAQVADFVKFTRDELGLNIVGLMCIPPASELASPYFALLAKLAKENHLANLSMGMSDDYDQAIALGATHIRVGSAIFGGRLLAKQK
jgi:pyridoxal phosphate enzyme (YggS family)